jgi:hypothetical protein
MNAFAPVLAAGGSMIFLAFVLVLFLALGFVLYTRKGSGISSHPSDGTGAPGAKGRGETAGDQGEGGSFGGAGTK